MQIQKNLKVLSLISIIFLLPFIEFIKNNINEIEIIIGKSFYFLIIIMASLVVLFTYILNFFFKKSKFIEILLIVCLIFWLQFKHNSLNLFLKEKFNKLSFINAEYSSEISLLLLLILSIYFSILIIKKNIFFKKFLYIFFYISFVFVLFQTTYYNSGEKKVAEIKGDSIIFPDKLNFKKQNIYFFILDGMQPIKEFENNFKLDLKDFLDTVESMEYKYIHDTVNLYDNTTEGLSAIFYLNDIFTDKKKLKKGNNVLYPTLLRMNNQSDLINNLNNLGYDFKWLGNFFAYCPKFNIRYCLDKSQGSIIDTYLYINFFRQSPLIQIVINFGYIFNFDFNKYFFFKLNDGIGRLMDYLKSNKNQVNKNTFYFVHHMSPHWPYINDENCNYKNYPGEKNYDGYKSAYLCILKKIEKTINYLNISDPNSTVIFQSDHNWVMSSNREEKKMIFNLIKLDNKCNMEKNINFHNVNILRLVFSCMTGNDPNYLKN